MNSLTILIEQSYWNYKSNYLELNENSFNSIYLEENILRKILGKIKSSFQSQESNSSREVDLSRRKFLKKAGLATIAAPVAISDFKNSLVNSFINVNEKYNPMYHLFYKPYDNILNKKQYSSVFGPDSTDIATELYLNMKNAGTSFSNLRALPEKLRIYNDIYKKIKAFNDPNFKNSDFIESNAESFAKKYVKRKLKEPFIGLESVNKSLNLLNHFYIKPYVKSASYLEQSKYKPVRKFGRIIFGDKFSEKSPILNKISNGIEQTTQAISKMNTHIFNSINAL